MLYEFYIIINKICDKSENNILIIFMIEIFENNIGNIWLFVSAESQGSQRHQKYLIKEQLQPGQRQQQQQSWAHGRSSCSQGRGSSSNSHGLMTGAAAARAEAAAAAAVIKCYWTYINPFVKTLW